MGDTLSLWCVLGVTGALQVFLCLSLPLPSPWVWLSGGQWISAILPKPLQVPSSFPACRNILPALYPLMCHSLSPEEVTMGNTPQRC